MKILVIHPGVEFATRYGKVWLTWFSEWARGEGYEVIDISNDDVTPQEIWNIIYTVNPDYIYHTGHGDTKETTISTNRGIEFLFWIEDYRYNLTDRNIDLLKNRKVFLLSCLAGKNLVPEMVKNGTKLGIGFDEEFCWVVDTDYSPEEDPYASVFGNICNEIAKEMVKGKSMNEIKQKAFLLFNEKINYYNRYLDENPDLPAKEKVRVRLSASLLEHDRDAFVIYSSERPIQMGVGVAPIVLGLGLTLLYYLYKKNYGK